MSFNTQGATPSTGGLSLSAIPQGTPQGKALSNIAQTSTPQHATYAPATPLQTAYGDQGTQTGYASSSIPTPNGSIPAVTKGLLPEAPTNQAITKHTATDVAGNTVTQHYAPPTTPGLINSTPASTASVEKDTNGNIIDPSKTQNNGQVSGNPSTYGGLINRTVSIADNNSPGLLNNLTSTASGNSALGQNAQDIASAAGQQIKDIGNAGVNQGVGEASTGTAPVGEGNARLTAEATAQKQQAVAQGANVALQGNAQALTGQAQQEAGYNNAANFNATNVSNANTTAGLASPQNIFGTLTDPTTGQPVNPQQAQAIQGTVQNLAQSVANGSIDYNSAYSQLSQYGPNVQNALLKTIQQSNPSFNVNQSQGDASGQQAVASTGGTIASQQQTQKANFQQSQKQAQNLSSQLNDLITTFGLNPSDINGVNAGIQKIAQNTSSPQYQALNNLVTDIVSTYSSILTPGASTDTARATAASLLNSTASGKSLLTTIKNLDDQANAKIAGTVTSGNSSGSTGGSSSNIYSF